MSLDGSVPAHVHVLLIPDSPSTRTALAFVDPRSILAWRSSSCTGLPLLSMGPTCTVHCHPWTPCFVFQGRVPVLLFMMERRGTTGWVPSRGNVSMPFHSHRHVVFDASRGGQGWMARACEGCGRRRRSKETRRRERKACRAPWKRSADAPPASWSSTPAPGSSCASRFPSNGAHVDGTEELTQAWNERHRPQPTVATCIVYYQEFFARQSLREYDHRVRRQHILTRGRETAGTRLTRARRTWP